MNTYNELVRIIELNLIYGAFISVLFVICTKLLLKKKIDISYSVAIMKWTLLSYAFLVIISNAIALWFTDEGIVLNRATGPYWWAYWLMLAMNAILPLLLFYDKLGRNVYFLLAVTVLMNVGWLFESFVIHVTSMQRDYVSEDERSAYLPFNREIFTVLRGLGIGAFLILLGNILWLRNATRKRVE